MRVDVAVRSFAPWTGFLYWNRSLADALVSSVLNLSIICIQTRWATTAWVHDVSFPEGAR